VTLKLHRSGSPSRVSIDLRHGVDGVQEFCLVERGAGRIPLVQVGSLADLHGKITGAVNQIISVVAALLGFAILIALIGIMNDVQRQHAGHGVPEAGFSGDLAFLVLL
jgi:hypothetical protein